MTEDILAKVDAYAKQKGLLKRGGQTLRQQLDATNQRATIEAKMREAYTVQGHRWDTLAQFLFDEFGICSMRDAEQPVAGETLRRYLGDVR